MFQIKGEEAITNPAKKPRISISSAESPSDLAMASEVEIDDSLYRYLTSIEYTQKAKGAARGPNN